MFLRSLLFLFVFTLAASAPVAAQRQQQKNEIKTGMPDASEQKETSFAAGDPIGETMEKMRIRAEEKEHAEFVERGEEVARLTRQISESFAITGSIMRDFDKLGQLEKTVKRIRKNLGGSDDKDDVPESNPASVAAAVTKLAEIGADLSESVKTSSRHTISADSIDDANELLELINFIRRAPR